MPKRYRKWSRAYYKSNKRLGPNSKRVRRGLYRVKYRTLPWIRYIRSKRRGLAGALTKEQRQALYHKLVWDRRIPWDIYREIMKFAGPNWAD